MRKELIFALIFVVLAIQHAIPIPQDFDNILGEHFEDGFGEPIEFESPVAQIALGQTHAIALLEDGTLRAWGENQYGQCNVPADIGKVRQVSAGLQYSAVVLEDGKVIIWGAEWRFKDIPHDWHVQRLCDELCAIDSNGKAHFPRLEEPPFEGKALDIVQSQNHVTTLAPSGGAHVYDLKETKVFVSVKMIDASEDTTVLLGKYGTIRIANHEGWSNEERDFTKVNLPVVEGEKVERIRAGYGGVVYAIFDSDRVQIFKNNKWQEFATNVKDIKINGGIIYLLKSDGTLLPYGSDLAGCSLIRTGKLKAKKIAFCDPDAELHSMAGTFVLRDDHKIVHWTNSYASIAVSLSTPPVIDLAASPMAIIYVLNDGTLHIRAWERTGIHQSQPKGSDFQSVAVGNMFAAAIRENGELEVWGTATKDKPFRMPKEGTFHSLAALGGNGVALTNEGKVCVFGLEPAFPPQALVDENYTAIAPGEDHTLGLLKSGKVVAWGSNERQQCKIPKALPECIDVAAGDGFSMAITKEGRAITWGMGHSKHISDISKEPLKEALDPRAKTPANLPPLASATIVDNWVIGITKEGPLVSWPLTTTLYPHLWKIPKGVLGLGWD